MTRFGRLAAGLGPLLRLALLCLAHGPPRPLGLARRLADLPLDGAPVQAPVTIRWSDRHVPHIEATSDIDLAVGIGVAHAHLRLAQMEVLRRIARGRTAELVGALALPLDHSLRVLDLARAVPAILDAMAPATRAWLDGFVAGVNHIIERAPRVPPEFAVLGLGREPWTAADVLAIGRLASWDVSWLVLFAGLRLAGRPDFDALWRRMGGPDGAGDELAEVLEAAGHGSNAFAVAPRRSASGGALLASDPHLGLHLPGLWIAAGLNAPGFQAAGLMLPGLPFVAIGRNPWLAWGGTNLHALSSELIDVTEEPATAFKERIETIAVRWSQPRRIRVRESAFGPVVTDAPLVPALEGRTLALRWVGHRPSDELDAMLRVNRARTWDAFRSALTGFAVPGQTFVYAGSDGGVGAVCAAHLPRRADGAPVRLATPAAKAEPWEGFATSDDLPWTRATGDGLVVSANERPAPASVRVGAFFSSNERADRLRRLLVARPMLSAEDMGAIQRDVHMATSLALRDALVAAVGELGSFGTRERALLTTLTEWDGDYTVESPGAATFEIVLARFIAAFLDRRRLAGYRATWRWRRLLLEDLRAADPARVADALRKALAEAAPKVARQATWGAMHRLRLAHPLRRVPLVGWRWPMVEFASPGSDETVAKAANGPVDARHAASYGANARWVSDCADADANFFVLLGGQDGWPGGATLLDQVPLWRDGRMVRVPLSSATARAEHPHVTVLRPKG